MLLTWGAAAIASNKTSARAILAHRIVVARAASRPLNLVRVLGGISRSGFPSFRTISVYLFAMFQELNCGSLLASMLRHYTVAICARSVTAAAVWLSRCTVVMLKGTLLEGITTYNTEEINFV